MAKKEVLTAKDVAKMKILVQYEVKPVRDEVKALKKEVKELKKSIDALTRALMSNVLTVELNKALNPPAGIINFTQKDGTKSEPPY